MVGVRSFRIDAFPERAFRSREFDAIVVIDVMLAATTAVTCVAHGRQVFLARTPAEARERARGLFRPVLAQEDGGLPARGFEIPAGPASLSLPTDLRRPLVLVSHTGQFLADSEGADAVYVACLRNISATARLLCAQHRRVAILGAGYGGELRCEDQMAAAWIGRLLAEYGFKAEDLTTQQEIERWAGADVSVLALGKAADYLRRLGQQRDLDFVLAHVDDVDLVCRYVRGELRTPEKLRRLLPTTVAGPVLGMVASSGGVASAKASN